MAACEWNPKEDRAAYTDDEYHGEANWIIGHKGDYFLCDDCAKLKKFDKYRTRKNLGIKDMISFITD